MATLEPSSGIPDKRRAWPLALLFGIGNCALVLMVLGVDGYLREQTRFTWLIGVKVMLDEFSVLRILASLPLIVPPVVGMILQQRGKEQLGRALVLSLPWTIVVYAVGAVGLLAALILRPGGLFQ